MRSRWIAVVFVFCMLIGMSVVLFSDPNNNPPEFNGKENLSLAFSDLIQRYVLLNDKFLRTQEEEDEFNLLLANEDLLIYASNFLMDRSPATLNEGGLKSRLSAVDLLRNAIAWNENPNRRSAIDAILRVLAKSASATESMHLEDCLELFTELSRHAPEEAEGFLGRLEGMPHEQVFRQVLSHHEGIEHES